MLHTAEYISNALGSITVALNAPTVSTGELGTSLRERPLMTPDEIMQIFTEKNELDERLQIIFTDSTKPMQGILTPWYSQPAFKDHLKNNE